MHQVQVQYQSLISVLQARSFLGDLTMANSANHLFKIVAWGAVCASALLTMLPAEAATPYSEAFPGVGNLAGWTGNTTDSVVVNPGNGGNNGGYLLSRRDGAFPIGALTELDAATGSFAGSVWTASVDLSEVVGDASTAALRMRYQDSSFNGWSYLLTNNLGGGWTNYSVTFDPSWSDAEAGANGWVSDGGPAVSFAQTMSDVYTTEIRINGSATLSAGIDNFELTAAIPEPQTYALMALGLALLGLVARRRKL